MSSQGREFGIRIAVQTLMPHGAARSMNISTPTPSLPPQRGRVRVGGGSICVLKDFKDFHDDF